MRFGMMRIGLLVALSITGLAHAAQAQVVLQPKTWVVSGMVGAAIVPDASNSVTIAGAAAYPISKQLAVEGELGHVLDISPSTAAVDTSLTTVHGSALYLFDTEYVLTPYLAGGIGLAKYSVDVTPSSGDFSTTEFGFNLGAGVLYPFGGAALFRGDFRYFKHIDNLPSVWRLAAGVSVRLGS
jgi:opacity protein-like surface antigen